MLSPAKINLGLEVTHRRGTDGYHCLNSIFVPISFGDEITFAPAQANRITTVNELPSGKREGFEAVSERGDIRGNLLWKILQACEPEMSGGVHVHLIKRIPTGAGLGGGSSNAGKLLDYVAKRHALSSDRALAIAVEHGADIPFFLKNEPMLVGGIGEVMEPIQVGPAWGVVCIPPIAVETGGAYAALKRPLQEGYSLKSWSLLDEVIRRAVRDSDWNKARVLRNDFEEIVFARHPELAHLKSFFLEHGAAYASLSGSGSAVYALIDSSRSSESVPASNAEELSLLASREFPEYVFAPFRFLS